MLYKENNEEIAIEIYEQYPNLIMIKDFIFKTTTGLYRRNEKYIQIIKFLKNANWLEDP